MLTGQICLALFSKHFDADSNVFKALQLEQNNGLTIELYSRYMTEYNNFHQYHCTYDVRNYYHKVL